jgi:hypothetical protein
MVSPISNALMDERSTMTSVLVDLNVPAIESPR